MCVYLCVCYLLCSYLDIVGGPGWLSMCVGSGDCKHATGARVSARGAVQPSEASSVATPPHRTGHYRQETIPADQQTRKLGETKSPGD